MKFEEIYTSLQNILPYPVDSELLEGLVMQSSYIVFEEEGETVFRPGDGPMGFYWLLSGQMRQSLGNEICMVASKGQMAGLEEFINHLPHQHLWLTNGRTEALFIDRRAFDSLVSPELGQKFIRNQLAAQLVQLKNACEAPDYRLNKGA